MNRTYRNSSDADLDEALKSAYAETGEDVSFASVWRQIIQGVDSDTPARIGALPQRSRVSRGRRSPVGIIAAALALVGASVAGGVGILNAAQDDAPARRIGGVREQSASSTSEQPQPSRASSAVANLPCDESFDSACGDLVWVGGVPGNEAMQLEVRASSVRAFGNGALVQFEFRGSDSGARVDWERVRYSDGRWQVNSRNFWKPETGCSVGRRAPHGRWTSKSAAEQNGTGPANAQEWQTIMFQPREMNYTSTPYDYFASGSHAVKLLFHSHTCGPFDEIFGEQREVGITFTVRTDGSISDATFSGIVP